ncbi:hypothetical protein OESDEN_12753, partial [Oesophagostomum dentatum]
LFTYKNSYILVFWRIFPALQASKKLFNLPFTLQEVYCANHVPIAGPHDLPPSRSDHSPVENGTGKTSNGYRRDAGLEDMKIAHAIKATQVAKPYPKIVHKGARYAVDYDAQTRLELLHRRAEDQLYDSFQNQRTKENEQFESETREEWERALADFARKYEKGQANMRNKDDLIRQLTIKREKKLETLHTQRRERERHQTAELVDRQAREMLDLFKQARSVGSLKSTNKSIFHSTNEQQAADSSYSSSAYPSTPPPPQPPSCSKREIYTSTEYFSSIDEVAIHCARSEMTTFTDLIRALTSGARSDIDMARAIYRWITIKNLNTMIFDDSIEHDTPMGLLRGIKYGTESYHVLFKRLCSYAGLHCVVIKGYSKSAGYQPGYSFDDNRFRNTWNAVYLDGSWRFVQCNWGARHLVNAKDSDNENRSDGNLRYEYDDHYFMTDPETDKTGATSVAIRLPEKTGDTLIFHYNLKFFDSEENTVNGLSLKRFVMQSVANGVSGFVPSRGDRYIDCL